MKYVSFLFLFAVHFILVSTASESSSSENTENVNGNVNVLEAKTIQEEEEIFDIAAAATTDDVTDTHHLNYTRLTASLHEEFVIFQCTIDLLAYEDDLDLDPIAPIQSTRRYHILGNERISCCDWIVETANKLLHDDFDDGPDDDDDDDANPSWTASLCVRHLAAVPTTTSTIWNATFAMKSQVEDSSQLATYMFLYPRRRRETANGVFPPSPTTNKDGTCDNPSHSWKHFVWSAETETSAGTGQWLTETNERHPAISFVQKHTNDTNDDDDADDDAATVNASLTSTLSETGGMHRDFHHVLQLGNIPQECQSRIHNNNTQDNSCTFSVWISLYLAADVFINTEDAFSSNANPSIEFQIVTADNGNELIDQEEPAFCSPWHVVLIHLQGPVSSLDIRQMHSNTSNSSENDDDESTTMVIIEWDTFLHIRYPSPVVHRDFARLHVLAPQLVHGAGFLQSTGTATNTNTRWKMMIVASDSSSKHKDPVVLSTWVAVAREDDYPWILGLTMIAATVGAAVMLRDISRVASWS